MKGIILAGGSGTRLYPLTKVISKQLLPIFDKPMIYYPLSILMLAGIKEILIITTPEDLSSYKKLLGNGSEIGINISFAVQEKPQGLAQAFIIGESFIDNSNVCLILGDNIFYGQGLSQILEEVQNNLTGATIFGYRVKDPERFGVVEFNENNKVLSVEEKPKNPKSNYAITGLYFYDNKVVKYAKKIKQSNRGEYEITSINKVYLENNNLNVKLFGRGFAWLDTGTHETLLDASLFVKTIEERQGLKISCIEEISYNNNWLSYKMLQERSKFYSNDYGLYIKNIKEK